MKTILRGPSPKKILITAPPGIGKTTLSKKLEWELADLHPAGFYTEEIRENGIRKGFELISLSGRRFQSVPNGFPDSLKTKSEGCRVSNPPAYPQLREKWNFNEFFINSAVWIFLDKCEVLPETRPLKNHQKCRKLYPVISNE